MPAWDPQRLREDLERLAGRDLSPDAYWREAEARVRKAVDADGVCWYTLDPATLLLTGHWRSGLPDRTEALTRNEYGQDDVSKYADLARRRRPVAVLSDATAGAVERSARYRDIIRPAGLEHELRAVFVAGGDAWGAALLVREAGRPDFTARDAETLAAVTRALAVGVRRFTLRAAPSAPPAGRPATPGVLVLDGRGRPELVTPAARVTLAALGAPDGFPLPQAVRAAASAAARDGRARAHVRGLDGTWTAVSAEAADGHVVVTLAPAGPRDSAGLRLRAAGLTAREQEVVALVAAGETSAQIALRLGISPHTVQDHLKAVFEKTGARTRRDVVARLFLEDHLPRLRSAAL